MKIAGINLYNSIYQNKINQNTRVNFSGQETNNDNADIKSKFHTAMFSLTDPNDPKSEGYNSRVNGLLTDPRLMGVVKDSDITLEALSCGFSHFGNCKKQQKEAIDEVLQEKGFVKVV